MLIFLCEDWRVGCSGKKLRGLRGMLNLLGVFEHRGGVFERSLSSSLKSGLHTGVL